MDDSSDLFVFQIYDSLALAPVSVLPDYQNRGIGGQLIITAHSIAKSLEHTSIILIGHKDYYPRFGYKQADEFGIQLPFEVPAEKWIKRESRYGSISQSVFLMHV